MTSKPSRVDDFELNEVADGYVVYHSEHDRVHYLNHTAALVLELCTGENDASEIIERMQRAYDLPEPPEQEIGECLERLREEGLVA
jgi:PqqD family protein of HPr-rel-A system